MMWIALIAVAVYLALKGAQMAFIGRASGYRADPVSVTRRLRRGEPALLVVAALITAPPALAAQWYHKHKFEQVLSESVACYGLVQAYGYEPEIKRTDNGYAIYESLNGLRSMAFDASRQLGGVAATTQRRLDRAATTMLAERRQTDEARRRDRLAATRRCLHPPEELPNA